MSKYSLNLLTQVSSKLKWSKVQLKHSNQLLLDSNAHLCTSFTQISPFFAHTRKDGLQQHQRASTWFQRACKHLIHSNQHLWRLNEHIHYDWTLTRSKRFDVLHLHSSNSLCLPKSSPMHQMTSCAPPRLQISPCALQSSKWVLVHLQSSKSALVHSKTPNQLLYTLNTQMTSTKHNSNKISTLATHMSGPITYWSY